MGFKIFIDSFDVSGTLVVYISYNMGKRDLPDIYALICLIYMSKPKGEGIYIRQIPLAHVITIT